MLSFTHIPIVDAHVLENIQPRKKFSLIPTLAVKVPSKKQIDETYQPSQKSPLRRRRT